MPVSYLQDFSKEDNKAQVLEFKPSTKKEQKKTNNNKKKGKSATVRHLEVEDMRKLIAHFKESEQWLPYLIFVLSCNTARRVGDTMSWTWEHFFNPATGRMRMNILEFSEEKTDKLASPRINSACRDAINLYIEKTGCDPSKDGYKVPICMQLSGNYKGRVLSQSGYLKRIKKAAEEVGIEYNVGTHSPRKTFGMMNKMLHPGDPISMEILQAIFNHSDEKVTRRYIGITQERIDSYFEDMGTFFTDYVIGDKDYIEASKTPVISLDTNGLMEIIRASYEMGKNNASVSDAMVHVEAITKLMSMVESYKK